MLRRIKITNLSTSTIFGFLALSFLTQSHVAWASSPTLTTQLVGSGFNNPVYLTAPPGDTNRLFVVEQVTARIRIIKNGSVLLTPFLDINSVVTDSGGEQGLLSMAFHPNYGSNGFFFVYYTNNSGNNVVARYHVSADPDVADGSSAVILFTDNQPFTNHNGGMLAFGPNDGFLYVSKGDGGSGNDPGNRAQNLSVANGKLLRVDVDHGSPFAVPANNPFVSSPPGADTRIWAYGLRNPWRFSFDRANGDLWIGDVGQDAIEELDYVPASSTGGENYGWKVAEGFECRGGGGTCGTNPGFTPPIYDYDHSIGECITGGYVYRGSHIPALQGTYFLADFQTNHVWSLRYNGSSISEFQERTAELDPPGSDDVTHISSFGEDGIGELYMVQYDGNIYKIVALDSDGDGINDTDEITLGTNPFNADTDSDTLSDFYEVNVSHTDPLLADTDGDGADDGAEIALGTDPLNTNDTPALSAGSPWAKLLVALGLIAVATPLVVRVKKAATRAR